MDDHSDTVIELRTTGQPRAVPTFFKLMMIETASYSCLRKIFCAERCAPVSSSNPDRNAQNIMLTEIANGP